MDRQAGFTLIELITVIVILGVLSVVALPRYIDLQDNAEAAALDGVKGTAAAAHAINLAAALASDGDAVTMTDCSNTGQLLQSGANPDGYTFGGATGTTEGASLNCHVTQSATSTSAAFIGYVVN